MVVDENRRPHDRTPTITAALLVETRESPE